MAHQDTRTLAVPRAAPSHKITFRKCKLFVVSGCMQGREFVVDKDTFSIGTAPNNDLVLEDATVSRCHCELHYCPEGYTIRDMGSTNGTIVQGMKVSEALMNQSTEFQVGKTRIVFCPLREATEFDISPNEAMGSLLGRSIGMRRIFYQAEKYAPTDVTMLIEGETGTGKEVLAEEIHRHSRRAKKPFVVIDCASLAKEIIESELFGHTKGAFTGANADRIGAFEHANGGTVFLDEIGDLSQDLQPKLLRVLEKKEIRRIGSNDRRQIDVRILSATNRKLDTEVNAGRFREDLYFRLSVVHLDLPALRHRKEDIPLLVRKFLHDFHRDDLLENESAFEKSMEALCNHNWPGNVRELRNLIEIASYSEHKTVDISALLYLGTMRYTEPAPSAPDFSSEAPFKDEKNKMIDLFEREYVKRLLHRHEDNISRAARDAGIERAYLRRLIKKHNLNKDQ